MKKVSVIVPAYNSQNDIEKCIKSILKQTYKDIEVIIVNDGSLDNTKMICEKLICDNKNIVLINKENEGPGIARKVGIENAKGEYISFIDSDDYIEECFYERLITELEVYKADIIECGYNLVHENGDLIKKNRMKSELVEGKENCVVHYIKQKNTTNYLCNKLYKRELFDGIEFQSLFAGEDACVLLQLFGNAKKIVVIPDNMYYYVQTATSLCRKPYNLKKNDSVQAGIFMYNYCKEKYPKNCEYYALYICSYATQCYANLKYTNIEDKEIYMHDMKNIFNQYYDKNNSKFNEVSRFRQGLIKLFRIFPEWTSFIYKKVLKK